MVDDGAPYGVAMFSWIWSEKLRQALLQIDEGSKSLNVMVSFLSLVELQFHQ